MISGALYSLSWFNGLNLISGGGLAVYINGPEIVSRSWVPIATNDLFLKRKQNELTSLLDTKFPLNRVPIEIGIKWQLLYSCIINIIHV